MKEEFIVIGKIDFIKYWMDSFSGFSNHVKFYIDNDYELDEYDGKPVYSFSSLVEGEYEGCKFVIFDYEIYDKTKEFLLNNDLCSEQDIFHGNEWVIYLLKNYDDVLLYPKGLRLEVCSRCQLNCVACYMRLNDSGSVGAGYMKFEDFKRMLDMYPFVKTVEISNNGEPFICPDIVKILEYAYEKGVEITVCNGTNFCYIKEEVLEAIVKYQVKIVTMSIDGGSNEIYSQYRVNGNFDNIIENIKKINYYKKKYNSPDVPLMNWKYILMNHNEGDIEKAIKMAEKLNCKMYFTEDWRGYTPKNPDKVSKLTGRDYLRKFNPKFDETFCLQMIRNPQVNWDGSLLGCCMTFRLDWKKNVFEDGLIESLNSDYYKHAIYKLLGDKTEYNEENQCTTNCNTYTDFISKGDCIKF